MRVGQSLLCAPVRPVSSVPYPVDVLFPLLVACTPARSMRATGCAIADLASCARKRHRPAANDVQGGDLGVEHVSPSRLENRGVMSAILFNVASRAAV
jgi:hypothetical protein